jgi:hypothetical protein
VTPAGSDAGDGSRAAPFATIAAGIAAATPSFKRVYVCTGSYAESIVLVNGVSVVGGNDCSDRSAWRSGAARSHVAAPKSPAVEARNIDKTTRLEGFEIVAPDAADYGASSIAMIAENAGALTVANARLAAGKGGKGQPGADGAQLAGQQTAAGIATKSKVYVCPPMTTCLKIDGSYKTFPGATAGAMTCVGASGITPEAGGAGGTGGVWQFSVGQWQWYGGYASDNSSPGEARTGAAGTAGTDGTSATAIGPFTPNGYTAAEGTAGTDGAPGKGGKGGDGAPPEAGTVCATSDICVGNPGAGGGAGGCPGLAGKPGGGGGASVAALLFTSPLTFDGVELAASDAGDGGVGSLGSDALAGEQGGATQSGIAATAGTQGGAGGRAGVSGSGAGGPSIAIAHTGGPPKLVNGTTTLFGKAGAAVPSQEKPQDAVGNGRTLPASAPGIAQDLFSF